MSKKRMVIIGAGGFAREVRWLMDEINRAHETPLYQFLGYVVSDTSRLGEHDSRDEVLGDYNWLEGHQGEIDALTIGIGTPQARLRVAADLERRFPKLEWATLIHPTALFDRPSCKIGHGVIICAGVLGTVNLVLEPFSMVNLACTLGHEAILRRGCVLNPTVNISGGVDIGQGALIGTGSQVLQYLRVGEGAIVGGGAVVTKDVPAGETVVGSPAKPLKKNT